MPHRGSFLRSSATHQLIAADDHASVQINIAKVWDCIDEALVLDAPEIARAVVQIEFSVCPLVGIKLNSAH